MAKKLVLFFDGTGRIVGRGVNTNVVMLMKALERQPDVVTFYDPGVGAFQGIDDDYDTPVRSWWRRVRGLAFGRGVKRNIRDGYTFLMEQWAAEDEIFLFGFSRGAYTARAVAGLVHMCGLLERGNEHLIDMVFGVYWRNRVRRGPPDWAQAAQMKAYLARQQSPKITFLGVFDTVKTLGLWDALLHWVAEGRLRRFQPFRDLTVSLPYTSDLPNVLAGRHAVAIDERRSAYATNLWRPARAEGTPELFDETWFIGSHSDVGGGYEDRALADVALRWMIDGAAARGLAFRADKTPQPTDENALGLLHDSAAGLWRFAGVRARTLPDKATIHPTVLLRWCRYDGYRPPLPGIARVGDVT